MSLVFTEDEERCIRMSTNKGGCGITSASQKSLFAHVAACCQYMPSVVQPLVDMGWSEDDINAAIDLKGVESCLSLLREESIYIGADGSVSGVVPSVQLSPFRILWGRAKKMYGAISSALESIASDRLRLAYDTYDDPHRQIAKLNSCCGSVSGKWLQGFPSAWWPRMTDDIFVLGVKFRCGIPICREGDQCMHISCKIDDSGVPKVPCGKPLDKLGDHAASCATGGHLFSRHGGLNTIVADAGKAAGYQVLMEQVVPDFARWKKNRSGVVVLEEARLDLELFGHPIAPTRFIDGTIKHPACKSLVAPSAANIGHVGSEGERVKWKRYPTRNGKEVIPCSMETWGSIGSTFEGLLRD